MRVLRVLRQTPGPDPRMQLIEEQAQPALARLMFWHLQQDLARFRGGMRDRPADLIFTDPWITGFVEFERQCDMGRGTDDVLRLVDICQLPAPSASSRVRSLG